MESIVRSNDFRRIYRKGKKYDRGPVRLLVFFHPGEQLKTCFLGRSRSAVKRNRIKRRLKECFREHYFSKIEHQEVDLLFMSDDRLVQAVSEDITHWIGELLQKAGVMEEESRAGRSE